MRNKYKKIKRKKAQTLLMKLIVLIMSLGMFMDISTVRVNALPAKSATATPAAISAIAGTTNNVILTLYKASGAIDTSFTGLLNVTVTGYTVAPNGSYGSFKGTALTGTNAISVNFIAGVATVPLILNKAAAQTIGFNIATVATPNTNTIVVTTVNAARTSLTLTQDITAPASNGGLFVQQPKVALKDAYGNICTNDSDTIVTVSKSDAGPWALSSTTTFTASAALGVVTFSGLGTINNPAVSGAQLAFNGSGLTQTLSGKVNLPVKLNTVTFNSNGGSSVGSQSVNYGTMSPAPAVPAKTDYTFSGWYTDNNTFNNLFNFTSTPITADLVLYAKWIPNIVTITTQPVGQTIYTGETLSLGITATWAASYQWYKGSTPISGATASIYTKTAAFGDAGNYYCMATNSFGSVSSNTIAMGVYNPPLVVSTVQFPDSTTYAVAKKIYTASSGGKPGAGTQAGNIKNVYCTTDLAGTLNKTDMTWNGTASRWESGDLTSNGVYYVFAVDGTNGTSSAVPVSIVLIDTNVIFSVPLEMGIVVDAQADQIITTLNGSPYQITNSSKAKIITIKAITAKKGSSLNWNLVSSPPSRSDSSGSYNLMLSINEAVFPALPKTSLSECSLSSAALLEYSSIPAAVNGVPGTAPMRVMASAGGVVTDYPLIMPNAPEFILSYTTSALN